MRQLSTRSVDGQEHKGDDPVCTAGDSLSNYLVGMDRIDWMIP